MNHKLVKESIEQTFARGGDNKLTSMGVGKIDQIKKWLESYQIRDYIINNNFVIDVRSNIDFRGDYNLGEFPSYIQFGEVHGSFDCSGCNLKSLRGCPTYVEYEFNCSINSLKSLEYGPVYVGDDYICRNNQIDTIEFAPLHVGGSLYCIFTLLSDEQRKELRNITNSKTNQKSSSFFYIFGIFIVGICIVGTSIFGICGFVKLWFVDPLDCFSLASFSFSIYSS